MKISATITVYHQYQLLSKSIIFRHLQR